MLKKRIIPALLLKDGRMVKGVNFDHFRDVGNPVMTAKVYNAQKVDELIFLDIRPNSESKEKVREIVREAARECFMPLTVGGGVASIDEIKALIATGADKVSINSAAVEKPFFIEEAANKFGNQCIVVSVDYRIDSKGKRIVYTHSGEINTGLDPFEHIKRCEALGAGEILLTCIDYEGTMNGYDFEYLKMIAESIRIPLIASGGAGTLNDFLRAFEDSSVSAVSAGSIFHFTDQSPIKTRFFLYDHNVDVRIK